MIDKIKYILDERNFENFIDNFFQFGYYFIPSSRDEYRGILTQANISLDSDRYIPRITLYSLTVAAFFMLLFSIIIPLITLILQNSVDQVVSIVLSYGITDQLLSQPIINTIYDFLLSIYISLANIDIINNIFTTIGYIFGSIIFGIDLFIFEITSLFIYLSILVTITTIGMLLGWYYPIYIAGERERDINMNLPYSLTYMLSIVSGGRNISGTLEKLSKQDDIYGEVSNEAKLIINRTRLGDDIKTSIEKQAEITPSEEFESVLNDMVDLLEHTSDIESFLEDKTDESLYSAQQELEQKYEMLEYLNTFVNLINFAPAMVVVLGITASVIQGETLFGIFYVTPAIIFIGNIFIFAIVYLLFGHDNRKNFDLDINKPFEFGDVSDMPKFIENIYDDIQDDGSIKDILIENPKYGFLITLPLYLPYSVLMLLRFEISIIIDTPVITSTLYIFVPILLFTSAYMILFELKYRRRKLVNDKLVGMFSNIKDKNDKGISLQEAIETETASRRDRVEKIINKYINKTGMTPITTKYALEKSANKLNEPNFKRSIRLLTDTINQTGQISVILQVIIDDLRSRNRLDRKRLQQANQLIVSIILSSIILLVVFLIIDNFLISQFLEVQEKLESLESSSGVVDIASIDFIFIQSAIVYYVVETYILSGIQTGFLRTGYISSGIKYSISLLIIGIVVLAVF